MFAKFCNFAVANEFSMKLLITGSKGQLGRALRRELEQQAPGISTYVDADNLDLTDRQAVETFLLAGDFTHVINCAAYTAVDRAEEDKMLCAEVNIDAVSNIARLADELGFKILHFSTDYVFDGKSYRPYRESDKPEPISVYGVTKRKSETALLGLAPESMIIRTSWLYSFDGPNFVQTMLNRSRRGLPLRVVSDQVGTPTYADDLAAAVTKIILHCHWTPGIFNFSNEGVASWYDLAVAAIELDGGDAASVVPVQTQDYPTAATRPFYSVLDKSKIKATFGLSIPHWHDALKRCISNLQIANPQ